MIISDKEKERITYSVLNRMNCSRFEPRFLKKRLNLKMWGNIEMMHGKEFVNRLLSDLQSNGIIEPDKESKILIVSKKGKMMLRRGWVNYERHWYDAEYIRKYTFIISIIALIVAVVGNENIWMLFKWIFKLLFG